MDLQTRWTALWQGVDPNKVRGAYTALRFYYEDRPYHNFAHLEQCFRELDQAEVSFDPRAAEVALWYHDVIYDPRRKDNEERSAAFAHRETHDLGAPYEFRECITKLILATKHNKYVDDLEAQTVVDIDLRILSASPEEYQAYAYAIRKEYFWVPEAEYIKGRAAVLSSFLKRPRIYYIERFHGRYEQAARRNLAQELQSLK